MFDSRALLPIIERLREIGAYAVPTGLIMVAHGFGRHKTDQIVSMFKSDRDRVPEGDRAEFEQLFKRAGSVIKHQYWRAKAERG